MHSNPRLRNIRGVWLATVLIGSMTCPWVPQSTLASSVDIHRQPSERETPHRGSIIDAVTNGYFDEARALIEHGANVNAETKDGSTALMYSRTPKMARLLIDHGANVNHRNRHGQTALIIAAGSNYGNAIIPTLLSTGAHVNDEDNHGDTALTFAAVEFLLPSVRLLIAHGANVNHQNHAGRTPLMCASLSLNEFGENYSIEPYQEGAAETVAYLVEHGARVEARDNRGNTALIWAAHIVEYDHDPSLERIALRIMRTLLNDGADVNAKDGDGNTPLIWAARIGPYGSREQEDLSIRYAKLLLAHGANVHWRNRFGSTCIDIARANGFHKLAALFESAGKRSQN